MSSPDRYQPEKCGKYSLFGPVLILKLKMDTCILDDPVLIFLLDKKQKVDVPEEEKVEVPEAVEK